MGGDDDDDDSVLGTGRGVRDILVPSSWRELQHVARTWPL